MIIHLTITNIGKIYYKKKRLQFEVVF